MTAYIGKSNVALRKCALFNFNDAVVQREFIICHAGTESRDCRPFVIYICVEFERAPVECRAAFNLEPAAVESIINGYFSCCGVGETQALSMNRTTDSINITCERETVVIAFAVGNRDFVTVVTAFKGRFRQCNCCCAVASFGNDVTECTFLNVFIESRDSEEYFGIVAFLFTCESGTQAVFGKRPTFFDFASILCNGASIRLNQIISAVTVFAAETEFTCRTKSGNYISCAEGKFVSRAETGSTYICDSNIGVCK